MRSSFPTHAIFKIDLGCVEKQGGEICGQLERLLMKQHDDAVFSSFFFADGHGSSAAANAAALEEGGWIVLHHGEKDVRQLERVIKQHHDGRKS
ncbi:hypothetical protein ACOMHN_024078 [Nucella lapillus]